jgi:uncharacterized FAD-dependent dehydrogenase
MHLQRHNETLAFELSRDRYACPIQWATDFLEWKRSEGKLPSSYPRDTINADVGAVIPPIIAKALRQALPAINRRWQGRFLHQATIVGPESRGSAPVRIPRDQATREATGVHGLYPIGEGAGYAGGIVSAAVDGLRTAKSIIATFAPFQPK